jgi:ribonuclease Z
VSIQVLGRPGWDNAVWVRVDTGKSIGRLLFDCGEGCPREVPFAELKDTDGLFFSHFHFDHVAGFDGYFRGTCERTDPPNRAWGPAGSADVLQHRFRGYLWNLAAALRGTWLVYDIHPDRIEAFRFELGEAFAVKHAEGAVPFTGEVLRGPGYGVEAVLLAHGTASIGYVVREDERLNLDPVKMAALGLPPGPWAKRVRSGPAAPGETVRIGGSEHALADLQAQLLTRTPGDSVAYLTDFRAEGTELERVAAAVRGVGTLVCECQYRAADAELAARNHHMTTPLVGELAARAGVGRVVLFHLSDRYTPDEWRGLRDEVRRAFANADFPEGWGLDGGGAPAG